MHHAPMPRYPYIRAPLVGVVATPLAIAVTVANALQRHGVAHTDIIEFFELALAGDADNAIEVAHAWVDIVSCENVRTFPPVRTVRA